MPSLADHQRSQLPSIRVPALSQLGERLPTSPVSHADLTLSFPGITLYPQPSPERLAFAGMNKMGLELRSLSFRQRLYDS